MIEGTRRRTQVFEGIVIARQGTGARETFTVRKQSFGVGVERTFPVHSPKIERLEVVARGDVRRAKLYYLRGRVGKRARVAERRWGIEDDLVLAEAEEPAAVDSEGVTQEEVEPGRDRRGARGEDEAGDGGGYGGARRKRAAEVAEPAARPRRRRRGRLRAAEESEAEAEDSELIPKPTTGRGAFVELVVIVALALGLALGIQAFIVKPYQIPSRVDGADARRRPARARQPLRLPAAAIPKIGDIVVFHPPDGAVNGRNECGVDAAATGRLPGADDEKADDELHQARSSPAPATRSADRGRQSDRQRRADRPGRLDDPPKCGRRAAISRRRSRSPRTTTS